MPSFQASAKNRDYTLTEDGKGGVILHRPDCGAARALAAIGRPVITMFACEHEPPADLKRHSCLDGD